jgi:hypothetical protein
LNATGGAAALALAAALCIAPAGAGDKVGKGDDSSHLALYGRENRTKIPQPAALLIFGLSLLGLGVARRRKP